MKIKQQFEKIVPDKLSTRIILVIAVFALSLLLWILTSYKKESQSTLATVEYSFSSDYLPVIDTGHYALWGVKDEIKVLLKRFSFHNSGLYSLDGTRLTSIQLPSQHQYPTYEITVESIGDRNEEQSGCILMNGNLVDSKVSFTISALNFNSASGSFILATPTDGTSETNETSGIWFGTDLDSNNPKPALKLPNTGSCWTWAAYIEHRGTYLRIGRFDNVNQADTFSDYSFAQIGDPLQIPGEDFLRNIPYAPLRLNNVGNRVIVGIEPRETELRLTKDYRPFWPILEYIFNGEEGPKTPIELNPAPQGELVISIEN